MFKNVFRKQIQGYCPILAEAVQQGFDAYFARHAAHVDKHNKRTRACLIHDYIVDVAKQKLPSPDFVMVTSRLRNLFNFQDKALIQFKKLDQNMAPSNISTHQADLFDQIGEVDGLGDIAASLPLITVGYVPERYFTGIEGIFMTQIVGRKAEWHERIDQNVPETKMTPLITSLDEIPTNQSRPTRIANRRSSESGTRIGNS